MKVLSLFRKHKPSKELERVSSLPAIEIETTSFEPSTQPIQRQTSSSKVTVSLDTTTVSTALRRASLRRSSLRLTPVEVVNSDDKLTIPRLDTSNLRCVESTNNRRSLSGDFSSNSNLVDLFRTTIMEDKEIHDQLINFAKNERNEENVLLFDDIMLFKKLTDSKHRRKAATRIYEKYLDQLSLSEININDTVRRAIADVCTQKNINHKTQYDIQLDEAMRALELAVLENLMDMFSRFSQSQVFKNHRREKRKSRSAPTTPNTPKGFHQDSAPQLKTRMQKTKSVSFATTMKRMSVKLFSMKPA
jgi:hypothetical protein